MFVNYRIILFFGCALLSSRGVEFRGNPQNFYRQKPFPQLVTADKHENLDFVAPRSIPYEKGQTINPTLITTVDQTPSRLNFDYQLLDDKNNQLASLTATFKQPQNGAPAILKLQTLNVHNQLRNRGVGSWLIESLENRVTNYSQQPFIFRADAIIRGSAAFNGNKENLNIKDRKRVEFYEKLGFKIKKYSKKNMSLCMEKTVR